MADERVPLVVYEDGVRTIVGSCRITDDRLEGRITDLRIAETLFSPITGRYSVAVEPDTELVEAPELTDTMYKRVLEHDID